MRPDHGGSQVGVTSCIIWHLNDFRSCPLTADVAGSFGAAQQINVVSLVSLPFPSLRQLLLTLRFCPQTSTAPRCPPGFTAVGGGFLQHRPTPRRPRPALPQAPAAVHLPLDHPHIPLCWLISINIKSAIKFSQLFKKNPLPGSHTEAKRQLHQ